MRLHTGERPYVCKFEGCSKAFGESGALTLHMRVHTGERPFVCRHIGCGKAFKASGSLSRHVKLHERWVSHEWIVGEGGEFPNGMCDARFGAAMGGYGPESANFCRPCSAPNHPYRYPWPVHPRMPAHPMDPHFFPGGPPGAWPPLHPSHPAWPGGMWPPHPANGGPCYGCPPHLASGHPYHGWLPPPYFGAPNPYLPGPLGRPHPYYPYGPRS